MPLAEGGAEAFLLRTEHLLDERPVLDELGVRPSEALDDHADERAQHLALHAELAGVRDHPAQHAPEDVPASLVRGLHPVGHEERRCASVLADDPDRDVVPFVGPVVLARERLHDVEQRSEQVGLEEALDVLQHHRHAFDARASVDVLQRQVAEHLRMLVDLVLHEDVVPDLHEAVLVDVGPALGPKRDPRSTKISEHGPAGPAACVHQ